MAGFTVGNTNIFTSNTFSGTFNGFTSTNQLVFEAAPVFQGSVSGYASGGFPSTNVIDKFSFSVDGNASDIGDLTFTRSGPAGQSSTVSGYNSGGYATPGPPGRQDAIDKFPFATDTNATDVGNLTVARSNLAGQSSRVSGYSSGGYGPSARTNIIDKFPFATDVSATDVGDMTNAVFGNSGQSSDTNGYNSGGNTPPTINVIEKFPFSSDTGSADVGDLSVVKDNQSAGQSSETDGYSSGGYGGSPAANLDVIDKFPFATDSNATDIGNLTVARRGVAGQSSTVSGYSTGGNPPAPGNSNVIDKFPFATDTNASDVGDLSAARGEDAGQQV